jgi:hypothetical protein
VIDRLREILGSRDAPLLWKVSAIAILIGYVLFPTRGREEEEEEEAPESGPTPAQVPAAP